MKFGALPLLARLALRAAGAPTPPIPPAAVAIPFVLTVPAYLGTGEMNWVAVVLNPGAVGQANIETTDVGYVAALDALVNEQYLIGAARVTGTNALQVQLWKGGNIAGGDVNCVFVVDRGLVVP